DAERVVVTPQEERLLTNRPRPESRAAAIRSRAVVRDTQNRHVGATGIRHERLPTEGGDSLVRLRREGIGHRINQVGQKRKAESGKRKAERSRQSFRLSAFSFPLYFHSRYVCWLIAAAYSPNMRLAASCDKAPASTCVLSCLSKRSRNCAGSY